ncbi:MAG TPA: DHH family phosphoesterase [bacterium]|nr:DHH family phosphoesterase [bacterium]
MAFNQEQQFKELIQGSENILITCRKDYTGDALATALALAKFLLAFQKKCTLVIEDFKIKPGLAFLSGTEMVLSQLKNLCHFLIEVDLSHKKIGEFSYDVVGDKMQIYLLPTEGQLSPSDVRAKETDYRFDLIIILDTPDLISLGNIYNREPDFFFKTTIINIDHHLYNENYGQLNLLNPNQSSVAEIVFHLLKNWDLNLINADLATLLLAGLIHKTQSFRQTNLAPETLLVTSELISLGADKEKIITNFYQTKKMNTMKLWGRVLARLQLDKNLKLVWAVVPHSDFVKTSTTEEELAGLAEDMVLNSPQAQMFLLIYETALNKIMANLYVVKGDKNINDARWLLNNWETIGTREKVSFEIKNKSLAQVEMELVADIRNKITN